MFDKLVESRSVKNGRKFGKYLTMTLALYVAILIALTIYTIFGYGLVLANDDMLLTKLPFVPAKAVQTAPQNKRSSSSEQVNVSGATFTPPADPKDVIAKLPPGTPPPGPYVSAMTGTDTGDYLKDGIPGGSAKSDDGIPPAPSLTPKPNPPIEKKNETIKVSEGVLQGGAIHRPKPDYPTFARQIRAAGIVQVQILISENGKVLQATAINGHQSLRRVAENAAKQWIFSPTLLSKVPVKAQGIISFNFILN